MGRIRTPVALLAANTAFYDALESLDLDRMVACWSTADDVWCVHPGGEMVLGAAAVRRSWGAVFAATASMHVVVTDVVATASGGLGVVRCTENVLTSVGGRSELGAGRALTVNVFREEGDGDDGAWLLVGHHAAPPLRPAPTPGGG